MSFYPGLQWIAAGAFERLLYCLAEGTLLAVVVALALRLSSRRSSQTRFVIWFSALLATVALPLINVERHAAAAGPANAIINVPASGALYVVLAWLALAGIGLARVMMGLWQVRRLHNGSHAIPVEQLGPELEKIVQEFSKTRRVSILVSDTLEVPTAIGFFRPAVIVPTWLAQEGPSEELKHAVLHELAHLRRRDDWTNLIQKTVRAVLFFHPGVWWMDRELALDREMACDDAVVAQTSSPQTYAQCLAKLAEKNFLRRQIALAQAAVSRMCHLSARVARILEPGRPAAAQTWKSAVPAVTVLAALCGLSASGAPGLVKVEDGPTAAAVRVGRPALPGSELSNSSNPMGVRAWPAAMKIADMKPAATRLAAAKPAKPAGHEAGTGVGRELAERHAQRNPQVKTLPWPPTIAAGYNDAKHIAPRAQSGFVLLIATEQTITAGPDGWRVSVSQVRWIVPAAVVRKQFPNKT